MAEWLFRHHLAERGLDVRVHSAGTLGWGQRGATPHAVEVLAERGVVLGDHVATRLERAHVEGAELVIAMTRVHAGAVVAHDPHRWDRTFLPGEAARLAAAVGARRQDETVTDWARRMSELRDPNRPIGRAQDEIPDPAGQGIEMYREVADRLHRSVLTLSEVLAGVS